MAPSDFLLRVLAKELAEHRCFPVEHLGRIERGKYRAISKGGEPPKQKRGSPAGGLKPSHATCPEPDVLTDRFRLIRT